MQNIEYALGPYRVVDLSKHIVPGQNRRLCEVKRQLNDETGDYHSALTISSHCGTHVETPLHIGIDRSILDLPPTAFMGRAVVVDVEKALCGGGKCTLEALSDRAADNLADTDIAVLVSSRRSEPFEDLPGDERPQLTRNLARWLAKRVRAIALGNSVAIEKDNEESLKIHHELLHRDVLLIENLRNLESLRDDVFLLVAMPLPVAGLDSCPVYALGIEGVPGFCPEGE